MVRKAVEDQCRQCGMDILIGIDNDWCGLTAQVDKDCISAYDEAAARLSGLFTYEYRGDMLYRRDRWMIKGRRIGSIYPGTLRPLIVLKDHICYAINHDQHAVQPKQVRDVVDQEDLFNVVDHVVDQDGWETVGESPSPASRRAGAQAQRDLTSLRRKLSQKDKNEKKGIFDQNWLK